MARSQRDSGGATKDVIILDIVPNPGGAAGLGVDGADFDSADVIDVVPKPLLPIAWSAGLARARLQLARRARRAVDTRRRQGLALLAAASLLAVIGLVVSSVVAGPAGRPTPAAPVVALPFAPSGLPSLAYTFGPPGSALPGEGVPLNLHLGRPVDLAIANTSLYVLTGSALAIVDVYSGAVLRHVDVQANVASRLVLDPLDGRVWLVDEHAQPARIVQFDTATLTQTEVLTAPSEIYGATQLDGQLFLATASGVWQLMHGAKALNPVMATNPPVQALTIDPLHDTVLGLTTGATGGVISISSNGNTTAAGPALGIINASLAVIGNLLWVGGLSPQGTVRRIDLATMAELPTAMVGPTAELDVGDGVVSAGASDLWVYSDDASRLFCVDPNTGQELQRWEGITGTVTAGGSGPYAIAGAQVVPLVLRGGCKG